MAKLLGTVLEVTRKQINDEFFLHLIPGYDCWKNSDDYYFDVEKARHVVKFFRDYLSHVKGEKADKSFVLEPWQVAIIVCIFAFKHKQTNLRRYRKVFIYIPRKNGKTTIIAGVALYCLFCDGEPGAEIYCAAADKENATLLFEQCTGMIDNHSELSKRAECWSKNISLNGSTSYMKVLSADAKTKHGENTHVGIIDELHAQPNRELVDVISTSTGSRTQPIIIFITTADYDRPSVCNEEHDYACKVRDGVVNAATYLPVIYETDRKENWKDVAVWKKANPNYGISLKPEYMNEQFERALNTPSFENTFKRLHLNMKTENDVRWIPLDTWDNNIKTVDVELLKNTVCYGGLDLSTILDVTAFVLFFPEYNALLCWFWVPEENAKTREQKFRVPYWTWHNEGLIDCTPGNIIDYNYIRKKINELATVYNIREVGFDRYNASQLVTDLRGDGFDMKEFGQGYVSMNAPSKHFESLVTSKQVVHFNNIVLRWMVSNCSIEMDAAGNIKPSRSKSSEKIDGVVASVMGMGRYLANGLATSVYDFHGVESLG